MPRRFHCLVSLLLTVAALAHSNQAYAQNCGDGVCSDEEIGCACCPEDCGAVCGDGICSDGEEGGCSLDCGFCGDGICDGIDVDICRNHFGGSYLHFVAKNVCGNKCSFFKMGWYH